MADYEKQAERAEREAQDLERRSKQVGGDIEDARKEWEAKKADDRIPTADNPDKSGLPPEANYTTSGRGGDEDSGDELPPPDPTETD